ncbi:MAG: hypothetical protein AAF939_14585 [Planctomycetota bacterium]
MAKSNSFFKLFTFLLLGVLITLGVLWYQGLITPPTQVVDSNNNETSGSLKTEPEFRAKLVELRMERDKLLRGIERTNDLKQKTLEELKAKGIDSGDDFLKSDDSEVKYAAVNLKEWVGQISKLNNKVKYYDDAINGIQVMLSRIERERISESVALSEEEAIELQKIIIDLNERLEIKTTPFEDEELKGILDSELDSEPSGTRK